MPTSPNDDDRPWWRGRRGPSGKAIAVGTALLAAATTGVGWYVAGSSSQGSNVHQEGDSNTSVLGDGNSVVVNNYGPGPAAPSPSGDGQSKLCGAAGDSTVFGGWGPERPLWTQLNPPTFATVNSVRDNPDVGDERSFTRVRDATTNGDFQREVQLRAGHRYEVMVYLHESGTQMRDLQPLDGPTVSVNLPTCSGNRIVITGFITSDDTFPREVYDGAMVTADRPFSLAYTSGSARVVSDGDVTGRGIDNPEATLFTATGIDFRSAALNPKNNDQGYVIFGFTPQFADEWSR
ncbi:hypothetical protein ACNANV_05890 [Curtobacterium flaccumfaciens pv. flaccumfaciens]|uniref:hypothetical protein n=1 Tax=Curtobacterium flaccumfaciens TaxID=2035 RepID=UPI003A4DC560